MKNTRGYLTIIGANLLEPTLKLIEELEKKTAVEPNEVQTGQRENGFSCSIITLSISILESAFNRTKYLRKDVDKEDIAEYFSKISNDEDLAKDVDEIIAVRDAIVHNHLWEADIFYSDETLSLRFKNSPRLLKAYGNKRQRRVMNNKTRLSHRLELNLFPPRIWRRDAYIVFNTVYRVLSALEEIDYSYFPINNQPFMFSGRLQTLSKILDALPKV